MPTYLALRKTCHLANNKDKKRQEELKGMSMEAEEARARCPVIPLLAFSIKFIFNSVP